MRFYNPGRHDQYQGTELGVDSVLCMPIMDLEDNVMGVVELINKEGMIFCSYEINFFCSMFCFSSAHGRGHCHRCGNSQGHSSRHGHWRGKAMPYSHGRIANRE